MSDGGEMECGRKRGERERERERGRGGKGGGGSGRKGERDWMRESYVMYNWLFI